MTSAQISTEEQVEGDFTIVIGNGAASYVAVPSREERIVAQSWAGYDDRSRAISAYDTEAHAIASGARAADFSFRFAMSSIPFTPWHGFGGYSTRTGELVLS